MKKIITVFCLFMISSSLFIKRARAEVFIEEVKPNAKFVVYNTINTNQKIKDFVKIKDNNGVTLYDITPMQSHFIGKNYTKKDAYFTRTQLADFAKLAYFGYGYNGKISDEYYFATQYLIYQTFDYLQVSYQKNDVTSDHLKTEIAEIEEDMKESFSLRDFTIDSLVYELNDSYLVDNFTIEGENIDVAYEKEKIIINFLNNQEQYNLIFKPKNNCSKFQVWKEVNIELFPRMPICETEHQVLVENSLYKNEESVISKDKNEEKSDELLQIKDEVSKKEEQVKDTLVLEDKVEDENPTLSKEEVAVPNTYKNAFSWHYLLLILGSTVLFLKKK